LPEATQQAVPTELPAAKTVGASDSVQASRSDPIAVGERLSRQADFDRDAAEMVFKVIDSETDDVVRQLPSESQLRSRAYFRALDSSSTPVRRQHTDRTI